MLFFCTGISPVTGEFPSQRPVTRSFDVFFDLRLNQQLSKQWRRWWFEAPSHQSWRHHDISIKCKWSNVNLWTLYGDHQRIINLNYAKIYFWLAFSIRIYLYLILYTQLLNSISPLHMCRSIPSVIISGNTRFVEAVVWSFIQNSMAFYVWSQLGCQDALTTWKVPWHSTQLIYSDFGALLVI